MAQNQPERVSSRQDIQTAHGVQQEREKFELVEFGVQLDQGHEYVGAQLDATAFDFFEDLHHEGQVRFLAAAVKQGRQELLVRFDVEFAHFAHEVLGLGRLFVLDVPLGQSAECY